MARKLRAARIMQATTELLDVRHAVTGRPRFSKPNWYEAVRMIPPAEVLTRTYAEQHQPINPRQKKPLNLYRPTEMVYPEDQLRQDFYRDHPWELARPMMVLELDGQDGRRRDWSRGLEQPGMKLSGESVVQRQMWLMNNMKLSKEEAYDQARKEFYLLRQRQEIEQRIAIEEARMVGAYFGKSLIRVGQELEDKAYEKWKAWAADAIQKQKVAAAQNELAANTMNAVGEASEEVPP
ncbi:37s ribosomal protein rsm25 [Podospora conica]|nr:37s ribosomal protein rsm25 [Schizothecium conicum]